MSKARDLANAGTALGAVTATELGYVDGVTSAIQTQIDTKEATLPSQTGNSGKYLTTNGTAKSWGTVSQYALPTQTGNSGKYLTTDGSAESWGTVAAGGMTLLSTTTLSGASIIYVTDISQDYKELVINISGVTSTTSASNLMFLFAMNNTAGTDTYLDGVAIGNSNFADPTTWYNRPNIARITDDRSTSTSTKHSDSGNVFTIKILDYASSTSYKSFINYGVYMNKNDAVTPNFTVGGYTTNININKLYIGTQSAWLTGTVKVYGVK